MNKTLSLRGRLTAIILTPLVLIAVVVSVWAITDAQARADDRFNRALLSAALAVSRDVVVSDGDALSPDTNELLRDSFGGQVFYHVLAPDGAFVTGYATPPVPVTETFFDRQGQQYFEGVHQSRPVRAIRFVDTMQIDGLAGSFTVTIWQDRQHLNALVREFVQGTLLVISFLVLTVAFVVWFGVRFGLRPLNDLEDAIARRSTDDLGKIQRGVPVEVTGIVTRLNSLFAQLSRSMNDQMDFISNAAHQLRNPIAGILALAEATHNAPTQEEAKRRTADLLDAASKAAELSQKLLLMERAKALVPASMRAPFDLSQTLTTVVEDFAVRLPKGVSVEDKIEPGITLHGDELFIREAATNLIDNALRHGGKDLSMIRVQARRMANQAIVTITDNGVGLGDADPERALKRFEQIGANPGSGLGLSIVEAVMRGHGGTLSISDADPGMAVELAFPMEHETG
ncbi:MAG: sensor histidine kinase [Pseudomonadota bacterium]